VAGEQILVIDDQSVSSAFRFDGALSSQGYRIAVVPDGPRAVSHAVADAPALILLDASAPATDYVALLEQLRSAGIAAPAIVVLPAAAGSLDLRALQLGVSGVLQPPLTETGIQRAVELALLPKQLQRAHDRLEAQLRTEYAERRQLHAVGRALTTPIDNQQLRTRLVEAAAHLVRAQEGALYLRDEHTAQIHLVAHLGREQQTARAVDQPVRDVQVAHALESSSPRTYRGAQTTVDVPLVIRDRARGVLRVSRDATDEPFDARAYHKLSVLATYAVLAMENAHLLAAIQGAIERTAICQIGAFLASKLRRDEIRTIIVDVAKRILGADEGHVIILSDRGRGHPLDPSGLAEAQLSPEQRIVRQVLQDRRPAIAQIDGSSAARAVLCVPVEGNNGLLGAIYLARIDTTSPFTAHDRAMLNSLAANAAMALENARLFQQVETESHKLDAVLRGTRQPVIVTDGESKIVLINRAARRAFGIHETEQADDGSSQKLQHPALTPLLDQALLSGEVQYAEVQPGQDRTFGATVTPIPGVGLVTVLQDISEMKRLSQLKSEFVSTVSHDIRSPLSVVQGFLAVLGQAGPLNARQLDFVESAQSELVYLFDLTADLVDLGQVEAGIDLTMEPCDLVQLTDIAVRSWQGPSQNRKHTLTASLPEQELLVCGNAALLRRVIDNLLSNAVKFTPPGGQIEIRLRQAGHEAVLQIQDTGIGIAPEDQPYVFDRFYRAKDRITRNIRGTGLGLSIVRSVIERHKGRVWLESEPGVGTTVSVSLPLDSK
jgi:signal transduction histidine kinase/FixJ family two-component response regulator